MTTLENISCYKLNKVYANYFSLSFLDLKFTDKLACITLTCYITNELRKKGQNINSYDVLLKVGKDLPDIVKNTYFKSLAAICEDFLYDCKDFPDFGIPIKEMPKQLKLLLDNYCPF
mgnify:CR=1 FL=1